MPRSYRRLGYALVVLGVVLVCLVTYLFRSGTLASWKGGGTVWGYHLYMRNITFDSPNPKILFVDVTFRSNPGRVAVLNKALIINSTYHTIAEGNVVPNTVPENTTRRLAIELKDSLPPGTYVISLANDVYDPLGPPSPQFTVP